jgi:hypothetical protein
MLVGGAVVNVLLGRQVDRITLLNNSLKDALASREDEVKQLQQSLATHRIEKITGVEVYVSIAGGKDIPELDQTKGRLTMEGMVREWLQPLLGQEIDRLDHQLVSQVVDGRQVNVDGRGYVLRVKLVVVAAKTKIYVSAYPLKNGLLPQ